jgi:integrase
MQAARDGVWYLRVYDRVGEKQMRRTFRGTRRQAESELSRFVAEVEGGNAPASGRLTVADYLDRWLAHVSRSLQPGTVRSYTGRIKRLKDEIGTIRLSRLTSHRVDQMYAKLLTGGMSPATIRMHHSILSSALHQAVKWDFVPRAATDNATPPKVVRYRASAPDVETVRTLVARADETNPVLSAAIMLAAVTGCRRGELCGLRWSDIDRDRRVLHVRRAVKMAATDNSVLVGPTKTHQDRAISLDGVMLAVLDTHRHRAEQWAAQACVDIDPDGYILTTDPSGRTPTTPDVLTRAFVRLSARSQVECRFHDLRHFTATQLIGAGVDPSVVGGRLGHADATTTLRVYSHALAERDRAAAEVLGALMAPKGMTYSTHQAHSDVTTRSEGSGRPQREFS